MDNYLENSKVLVGKTIVKASFVQEKDAYEYMNLTLLFSDKSKLVIKYSVYDGYVEFFKKKVKNANK